MKEWQFTYKSVIFGWEIFYTSMVKGVLQLGFKDLDKVKAMTSRLKVWKDRPLKLQATVNWGMDQGLGFRTQSWKS